MIDITSLVQQFGSPLFVVREGQYRHTLRRFRQAFLTAYPRCFLAYSVKTNNLATVVAIAREEGYGAEVVSESEYALAEHLGIPGDQVVYNGPLKSEHSLGRAVERGSIINIDSLPEMDLIAGVCSRFGRRARIGVRVNALIGDLPWSKFGFSIENGEGLKACTEVVRHACLSLEGIHLHLGTNITDPECYEAAIQTVARFVDDLHGHFDANIRFVDLGGGFAAGNAAPPYQVIPDEWCVPSFEDYARTICEALTSQFSQHLPLLILEPGRALISEAVSLITKVISIKETPQGRLAIADAGTNVLPSASYLKHRIMPLRECLDAKPVGIDIYGPLCTQYDVLGVNVPLADLSVGDLLEVQAAGAYTLTFSSQFSFPRPAVVLIGPGDEVSCIRQRENPEDLYQRDLNDARLRRKKSASTD